MLDVSGSWHAWEAGYALTIFLSGWGTVLTYLSYQSIPRTMSKARLEGDRWKLEPHAMLEGGVGGG